MKDFWIITEENHGFLGAAETPLDAVRWLVRWGWLELDDPDAVSWYDKEKSKYFELSVREAAKRLDMSIEDFLEQALVLDIDEYELRFSLSHILMIEHDSKPLE